MQRRELTLEEQEKQRRLLNAEEQELLKADKLRHASKDMPISQHIRDEQQKMREAYEKGRKAVYRYEHADVRQGKEEQRTYRAMRAGDKKIHQLGSVDNLSLRD